MPLLPALLRAKSAKRSSRHRRCPKAPPSEHAVARCKDAEKQKSSRAPLSAGRGRLLVRGLVVLAGVQRLARELLALDVEQLDLEQVLAVVIRRDQREALARSLALVDGQIRELGRHDTPARTSGRPQTSVIAAPAPDLPRHPPITSSHRSICQSGFRSAVSSVKST